MSLSQSSPKPRAMPSGRHVRRHVERGPQHECAPSARRAGAAPGRHAAVGRSSDPGWWSRRPRAPRCSTARTWARRCSNGIGGTALRTRSGPPLRAGRRSGGRPRRVDDLASGGVARSLVDAGQLQRRGRWRGTRRRSKRFTRTGWSGVTSSISWRSGMNGTGRGSPPRLRPREPCAPLLVGAPVPAGNPASLRQPRRAPARCARRTPSARGRRGG